MVKYMTMLMVNIHEVKANLSKYLDAVARGETVIVCNRNVPVAELRALAPERKKARPLGLASGTFQVPPSFFEPLPDDVLRGFGGDA